MKPSDHRSLPYWLSCKYCKSSHLNHYTFLQAFYRFSGKRRPGLRSCLEALVRRSWLPQIQEGEAWMKSERGRGRLEVEEQARVALDLGVAKGRWGSERKSYWRTGVDETG